MVEMNYDTRIKMLEEISGDLNMDMETELLGARRLADRVLGRMVAAEVMNANGLSAREIGDALNLDRGSIYPYLRNTPKYAKHKPLFRLLLEKYMNRYVLKDV